MYDILLWILKSREIELSGFFMEIQIMKAERHITYEETNEEIHGAAA